MGVQLSEVTAESLEVALESLRVAAESLRVVIESLRAAAESFLLTIGLEHFGVDELHFTLHTSSDLF
ncbi:hypothetical protein NC981_18520 [Leptolyngbya sp. DQ-M1]|uniref:hypothetical protein n=1 Tax=Leptolyngbya sp. DQ-M1 TaxID=2933920 RepID=UPI003297E135